MSDSIQVRKQSIFNEVFQGYAGPRFGVRLWDGWQWSIPGDGSPACTIVVKEPDALTALCASPNEITLGEAFVHGNLDVEGDLFSAFAIAEHVFARPRRLRHQIVQRLGAAVFGLGQFVKLGAASSRRRDRASIAYHYDQPVDFFAPWLGKTLAYSCAYFRAPGQSLDQAQEQKLELVCRKLRIEPGERFLDIGCGWGSLPLHAAQQHRARAHGITLSREQARTAQSRIQRAGLERCCAVEFCDYRDLERGLQHALEPDPARDVDSSRGNSLETSSGRNGNAFDKIASIGMFEHVGLKNLPLYFGVTRRLLRPGGLMLNHGIARASAAPFRKDSFVSRYVFPDGRLVTLPQALDAAESQGLEVRDVENLREHYELTLRRWVAGLRENASSLLRLVPETTYRIWLLYMAGSAAAFRRGDIAVYQALLSRPERGNSRLPLTREDWYTERNAEAALPG